MNAHVDLTLAERQTTHGDFSENARISRAIKRAMVDSPNWPKIGDEQQEALQLIATKIGRILAGDAGNPDHWRDVAGYARLVESRL